MDLPPADHYCFPARLSSRGLSMCRHDCCCSFEAFPFVFVQAFRWLACPHCLSVFESLQLTCLPLGGYDRFPARLSGSGLSMCRHDCYYSEDGSPFVPLQAFGWFLRPHYLSVFEPLQLMDLPPADHYCFPARLSSRGLSMCRHDCCCSFEAFPFVFVQAFRWLACPHCLSVFESLQLMAVPPADYYRFPARFLRHGLLVWQYLCCSYEAFPFVLVQAFGSFPYHPCFSFSETLQPMPLPLGGSYRFLARLLRSMRRPDCCSSYEAFPFVSVGASRYFWPTLALEPELRKDAIHRSPRFLRLRKPVAERSHRRPLRRCTVLLPFGPCRRHRLPASRLHPDTKYFSPNDRRCVGIDRSLLSFGFLFADESPGGRPDCASEVVCLLFGNSFSPLPLMGPERWC